MCGAHLVHVEAKLVAYPIDRTLLFLGFALQSGIRNGVAWWLQFSQRGFSPCLVDKPLSPARNGRDGTSAPVLP